MKAISKHNQKLVDNAQNVQKFLERFLFESVIAGGLPRDIHYGLDAKDADVCVYNFHPYDEAERTLFGKMYNELLDPFQGKFGTVHGYFEGMIHTEEAIESGASGADSDDRQFWGVIKLPDVGVDIIFYEDILPNDLRGGNRIIDAVDLVDRFEANINQFVLEDTDTGPEFYGHNDIHPDTAGLVFIREDTSEARKDKMRKKWLIINTDSPF